MRHPLYIHIILIRMIFVKRIFCLTIGYECDNINEMYYVLLIVIINFKLIADNIVIN